MMKLILTIAAIAFTFSARAGASEQEDKYFKTGDVTVTSEVTERDLTPEDPFPVPLRTSGEKGGPAAAAVINTGMQAWNVVNSGKPGGSVSSAYASAVPGFSFNWANYSGWKKKEVKYTYTVTNLMFVDVIKVKYAISFYYNGQNLVENREAGKDPVSSQAQKGSPKGHFITNFTVRPLSINVKWGWNYSMGVTMSDPMNIGSSEKPVAHMQADVSYNVTTPFSSNGGTWTYDATGLGQFRDLTDQNKAMTKLIPEVKPAEAPAVSFN